MALIKNQTLTEFTGCIGKTVYKKRGDVNYMSALPRDYPLPQDPKSVCNRNQLFLTSKLAGLINAVDLFKLIWKNEFPKCWSPFNEISIANYHNYKFDYLQGNIVLTPKPGFAVPDPSFEIENRNLILKAAPLSAESGIDNSIEKHITSATIFFMQYNNGIKKPELHFDALRGEIISPCFDHPLQIITTLRYNPIFVSLSNTLVKLWSVLITLDQNDLPVRYSEVITWPPDIRHFVNDDDPNLYMKLIHFPDRKNYKNWHT